MNKIEDFDYCPHCKSIFGYYQKYYLSGWVHDNRLFKNGERENTEMTDHLKDSRYGKYYYCCQCNKRLCKI